MRLFLDTEFNGFNGKLLSMALVPEDIMKREFYKELEITYPLDSWVKNNVIPNMFLVPCSRNKFQQQLKEYLWEIGECTIVADWPDDIRYFCESLITGPGMCLNIKHTIKFELLFNIDYKSKVQHNALHDARAIRDVCMGVK